MKNNLTSSEKEAIEGFVYEMCTMSPFSVSPEAQRKLRDYLYREHGVTNIYAARMG